MASVPDTQPVALITGGTRGIGRAIADTLGAQGYALLLGYNSDNAAAEAAKRELESAHKVQVQVQAGDVADAKTCDSLFEVIRNKFSGRLTTVVHNAGTLLNEFRPPSVREPLYNAIACLRSQHQRDFNLTTRRSGSARGRRRGVQLLPGCVHSVFSAAGGRRTGMPGVTKRDSFVLAWLQPVDAGSYWLLHLLYFSCLHFLTFCVSHAATIVL